MTRLSADEVSAARRVPIEAVVAPVVRLDQRGFGLCPFHEERTPSFHVHRKRNIFKCFGCGVGGNPITFLQAIKGLDFPTAVRLLIGKISEPPSPQKHPWSFGWGGPPRAAPPTEQDSLEYIAALWDAAINPGVAEFYLESRGIRVRPKPLPQVIRGTERCWCSEAKRNRKALLAAATDDYGTVTALQRIWTEGSYESGDPKGAKAKLETPKKTIGRLGKGAVRLAPAAGPILGIAEGVETALSAAAMFCVPTWAALGSSRMGSIMLPTETQRVVVFGDNGEAGEKAANAAVSSYRRRGYEAEAVFPEPVYEDFNAQLVAWK